MEIYLILNRVNGKGYVGATKWSFNERYPQGKWWKWTHSPHLKVAYEKYGSDAFEVKILDNSISDEKALYEREKHFIAELNTFIPNGYNLTTGGSSTSPSFVREYELIDFSGNTYRVINLSSFCRKRGLNYSAMCNMVSGINRSSQGFALSSTPIEKITIPLEEWTLENIETGQIESVRRGEIRKWARDHGIKPDKIECVIYGVSLVSCGWKLSSTVLPDGYRGKAPKHKCKLKHVNGTRVTIENVYAFCKERGYDRGAIYDIISGKGIERYGWTLDVPDEEIQSAKDVKRGKAASFISPDGEIVHVKNLSAFCRKYKLGLGSIYCVLRGRTKQHKGWRAYHE